MGTLVLILGGLGLFLRGQLVLWLTAIFRPRDAMRKVTEQQFSIGRGLAYLAGFAGLRTDFQLYRGSLPRAFLMVSNHQSLADVALLPLVFPGHHLRFVAKSQLKYGVPYVSLALRMGRHAVISRTGDYRAGRRAMVKLADLSAVGVCPAVFPEGRRSRSGEVQDFQSGAFRIILERSPLPVISVAVDGGYRIASLGRLLTKMRGTWFRIRPLTLYPAPRGKKEILDLLARIKSEISEQVRQWRTVEA